jgi:hypothetical protein
MIPSKKKTAEEIAALREGLGIPPVASPHAPLPPPPPVMPGVIGKMEEPPAPPAPAPPPPQPASDAEPVTHLDPITIPLRPQKAVIKPSHSLRKQELPLAPAPAAPSPQRTELPAHRHDPRDVAQIRKREALAKLQQPGADPADHLRKQTASPFLYVPGYLLASAAALAAFQDAHYITPAALIGTAIMIMAFIAWRKPRSRHHAALLFIVVFLTLVFGALHYAPLFQNVP